jgi:endonuclease/exonuclease/phosphatase family metal-dependent hydrolase
MNTSLLRYTLLSAIALFVGCWTSLADSSRIKIATFNIQNFGPTKAADPDRLSLLATIIRKYDVVAVQEVSDVKGKAPIALLSAVNIGTATYKMTLSARTGQQANDKSSQEQYAFYYNTKSIRMDAIARLFPDSQKDFFQREPYVASFASVTGNFKFVLITVHTNPDEAVPEIAALSHVFTWARKKYAGRNDYIALGDFNAGCSYASAPKLAELRQILPYTWIVPDSSDSNLAPNSACPYDRIVAEERGPARYTGSWGVDEAFSDKAVSDHWPVWAEFRTGN